MSLKILDLIGSGSFGSVYKVEDEKRNVFAVKVISPKNLNYIELDILTRLRSPYLIKSLGLPVVSLNKEKGITMEFKEKTLHNLNIKKIPFSQFKRIIITALYGIQCLHKKGFIHRDLHASNILYDINEQGDYTSYISDFGGALKCNCSYTGIESEKNYMTNIPPENLQAAIDKKKIFHYNDLSDMWSIGLVFLQLLGVKAPKKENKDFLLSFYKNINEDFIEEKIRFYNKDGNIMSSKETMCLVELLSHLLKFDKDERLSSKNIKDLCILKNKNTENFCDFKVPSEKLIVPYISGDIEEGIYHIVEFFKKNNEFTIDIYFLAIELFIKTMTKLSVNYNLQEKIKDCIHTALNYYNKGTSDFSMAMLLNEGYGDNKYFYQADYLDDLLILNNFYILGNNVNFLRFYIMENPDNVYKIFRQKFVYRKIKKKEITMKEFMASTIPLEKEDSMNSFVKKSEYSNKKPDVKLNLNLDDKKIKHTTKKINQTEEIFRNIILDSIKENFTEKYLEKKIDIVNAVKEVTINPSRIDFYPLMKKKLSSDNFSKTFMNITDDFDYDVLILKEDENKDITKKYTVVIDNNRPSLLVFDKRTKTGTHYYSPINRRLDKFLNTREIKYTKDNFYGTGSCCKYLEACIVFIIFYNNFNKCSSFNIKCLKDTTLNSLMIKFFI